MRPVSWPMLLRSSQRQYRCHCRCCSSQKELNAKESIPLCIFQLHGLSKNCSFERVQPRNHSRAFCLDMWLRIGVVLPCLVLMQRHSVHHPRRLSRFMARWRTRRWNSSPILIRIRLGAAVRWLVHWRWYMIGGVVGYTVSLIPVCQAFLLSYLEEDTLALGSLHRPSHDHLKRTEVVDRNEPVVVWERGTVERQHRLIKGL